MTARTIYISGTPRGAARPRATRRGLRATVYTDPEHEAEMNRAMGEILRAEAHTGEPRRPTIDTMVDVWIDAYFPDKNIADHVEYARRRNGKPDGDNVMKLYVDAAVKALVLHDDALISGWHYTAWSVAPFRAGVRMRFESPPPSMEVPRRPWVRGHREADDTVVHVNSCNVEEILSFGPSRSCIRMATDDLRFMVARALDVLGGAR